MAVVNDAKAAGISVILMTVQPAGNLTGWTAGMQAQLVALNALIRATSGVTVVDAYSMTGSISDATKLHATYDSGDGLHPSAAGSARLALEVRRSLP